MQKTTIIHNPLPRLVEGPTLKGQVARFSPGNNDNIPAAYVAFMRTHKHGRKLFEAPHNLREIGPQQTAPAEDPPKADLPNTNPVEAPVSLQGYSEEEQAQMIAATSDTELLIRWGNSYDETQREEFPVTALIARLTELTRG